MTIPMFDKTKQEVADKVRKLLTQAEDPAATPEEAQAFTMKAQQLMLKYSIELAMISDATTAGQLVEQGWTVDAPYASHKVSLISAVARANDCRAIYTDLSAGRKRVDVVGYPGDVEWVQTLSASLTFQLAAALADAAACKPDHVHGRTFAVGFIQGFVAEVAGRLQQARRAAMAEAERDREPAVGFATESSVALVLVAKQERVEAEFVVRHPLSRTVHRHVRLQSWSGYDPGRAAGRRVSLARGAVKGRRTLSA